jgi:hypothetical protein
VGTTRECDILAEEESLSENKGLGEVGSATFRGLDIATFGGGPIFRDLVAISRVSV